MMSSEDATKRLMSKKQTLDDAYAAPANFLEIDVINPITHGVGAKRYTDYEVRMKVILLKPRNEKYLDVKINTPKAKRIYTQAADVKFPFLSDKSSCFSS